MNLIEEAKNNYVETIKFEKLINYKANLDEIWLNNQKDLLEIMSKCGSVASVIDAIDKTFMYGINFPPENAQNTGVWRNESLDKPEIREKAIDWHIKDQERRGLNLFAEPEHIQESPLIHHRNKVVRKGRILSSNFMRSYSIYNQIKKFTGLSSDVKVLELGAGCGHVARLLMMMFKGNTKYTIVDIPETLFYSYLHLRETFPEKTFLYVKNPEQVKETNNYDMAFVPDVFTHHYWECWGGHKEYDLFVNTASMGEMRNNVIHHWMWFIQTLLSVKHLYTLNRYLNSVTLPCPSREDSNCCSLIYDDQWNILNWEHEPPYIRCPYMDTLHAKYVEIVASRPNKLTAEEKIKLSQQLFDDAKSEDWFRMRGYYDNGGMTYRDNIMVNDFTTNGTLFKLWESIRLHKNPNNLKVMLEYLANLQRNPTRSFEEIPFYKKMLGQ